MDATDRLVTEIRALREGNLTPLIARDPKLDPYTLELTSLRDVNLALRSASGTVADILLRIETLQQQANAGDEESLAELLRIGAIVAGAI